MKNKIIIFLMMAMFFSGCQSWIDTAALKAGYVQKDKVEKQIEETRKVFDQKLMEKDVEIKLKEEAYLKSVFDKEQFAANALYGGDFAFQNLLNPDRGHIVMDNRINEARKVLPSPTIDAMFKENERVKNELNETLTSLAQLKKTHDEEIVKANQLIEDNKKKETDLQQAKNEKKALETEKTNAINDLNEKLKAANDKVIAKEHERGDDAKAIQAGKEKLSLGAGILAALCIAGSIWSPVMKTKCAIGAVIFGIAAVGIWYLTPVVVLSIVGLLSAITIGWAIWEHNKESKAALATYAALQEVKSKSSEVWQKDIAPVLSQWQTKYIKQNGKLIEVPDSSIASHIDSKLAATGSLDASNSNKQ